jgi:ABC-type ATPase involved in cell division
MIVLAGVTFAHDGGEPLLEDAALTVAPGEVVLIGAPAGAGASSLARLLAGRVFGVGHVTIGGRDLARLRASSRAALRRRLGVVPQDLALVAERTALANVELALEVDGVPRSRRGIRAAEALAAVNVPAEPAVAALPMAARQRVAWARAFVRNPDVLVADQPTSHQDADGAERFASLTAELAATGAACVILAREPHLVAAAARRGWRALTIHQRKIVDLGAILAEEIDAGAHVVAEIARPGSSSDALVDGSIDIDLDDDNVVPFPVARSASGGTRR